MSRTYEAQIEINATAQAVWSAVAEAEGIQSWFAPEAKVEPGEGGSIWVSWGPGTEGASRIEVWEPDRRLRYVHDRASGRGVNIVDFTIEGRDGAGTTLRLVNSGFGADASFDDELENTAHAWPLFLFVLKHGIENPHKVCRNVTANRMLDLPRQQAWDRLSNLKIDGERRYFDPYGEACYELRGLNRSLVAIFCESAGDSTMLTVMSLLYDLTAVEAEAARRMVEAVAVENADR